MIELESEPECGLELECEPEPEKADEEATPVVEDICGVSVSKKSKKKKKGKAAKEPDSPLPEAISWC